MSTSPDGTAVPRRRAVASIVSILSTAAVIVGVAIISLNRDNVEFGYYLYDPIGYVSSRSDAFSIVSPTGAMLGGFVLIAVGLGVLGYFLGVRGAQKRMRAVG